MTDKLPFNLSLRGAQRRSNPFPFTRLLRCARNDSFTRFFSVNLLQCRKNGIFGAQSDSKEAASLMIKLALLAGFVLQVIKVTAALPSELKLESPKHPVVKLTVPPGEILLELFPEDAPKHVESFLSLIEKGFYTDLTFHRVVPGFVIQGGCPEGTGMGGPGYNIPAEFNKRPHEKGTLAMARSGDPDSAGSQFYICLSRIPHFDGNYTVFGMVVKGHDLPEKVKAGDKMSVEIIQKMQVVPQEEQ